MSAAESARRYQARFPLKALAVRAVRDALRTGALTRQPCEQCNQPAVAHHPDYARPLDVMWLCNRHHMAWHRLHGPGRNGGDAPLRTMSGGHDLRGRRFGRLVCLYETISRKSGSVVWKCECMCGRTCLRPAIALLHASRKGAVVGCRECRLEWRGQNRRRTEAFVRAVRDGYTLYTLPMLARFERDIRDEIAARLGIDAPDVEPAPVDNLSSSGILSGSDFDDHACGANVDGASLAEMGEALGVTRERARQLQVRALQKLRRAARRHIDCAKDVITESGELTSVRVAGARCSGCGERGHTQRNCPQSEEEAA